MNVDKTSIIKAELRKSLRSRLKSLSENSKLKIDTAICRRVMEFDKYLKADTVFLYCGTDWEIDTFPLIKASLNIGKKVVLPKCKDKQHMEARYITSVDELIPGVFGIPEPSADCRICSPEDIDFAAIPCIACDSRCRRLGQGGGYYDRFLKNSMFYKAALCKSESLITEVPVNDFDEPVDCVITEKEIFFRTSDD